MARTLFFRMVLKKSSETTNNQFSVSKIFFTIYFFLQSAFWSLFNHCQRSQSNQKQCSLCCSSPCFLVLLCTHCRPLQCFSTYFRKLKEIRILWPIFSDFYFLWLWLQRLAFLVNNSIETYQLVIHVHVQKFNQNSSTYFFSAKNWFMLNKEFVYVLNYSLRPYGSRYFDIESCCQHSFFILQRWVRPWLAFVSCFFNFRII